MHHGEKSIQTHSILLPKERLGHSSCLPVYKIYVIFIRPKVKFIYIFLLLSESHKKRITANLCEQQMGNKMEVR